MNISKALKIKNRLVGELQRAQVIAGRENSRRSDNPSKVSQEEAFKTVTELYLKVVALREVIMRSSVGICKELAELAELKTLINWYSAISVREGEERVGIGMGTEVAVYDHSAYLNRAALDFKIEGLRRRVNSLQDFVDDYNATCKVDWQD